MYQICEKIRVKAAKIRLNRVSGQQKTLKPLKLQGFRLVRGTGLEFKKSPLFQQISSNFVINRSETIKHGTSQSSCFIRANTIKGQNKGKIKAQKRTVTQRKLHTTSTETTVCRIWRCLGKNRPMDALAVCGSTT